MFYNKDADRRAAGLPRLVAQDVRGRAVPARRPAGRPRPERRHALRAERHSSRRRCPGRSRLPCNAPAKAIHLLSGVSGWGYTGGDDNRTISMIVRLHYADGTTEDHPLENGVHFADYIRRVDVPGSKLAFRLRGQQIRYLAITPKRTEPIAAIEFVKGPDDTAPIVMAVTVEARE